MAKPNEHILAYFTNVQAYVQARTYVINKKWLSQKVTVLV